ncbi:MAG: flavin monoamine oxidase family protein [Actinomycetes bacterium]
MTDVDIVVVGAGFAGLSAAWQLKAAGCSVKVLEAANRVGGRTDTVHLGEQWLEAGGQWTGPGQTRVRSLAERYGAELFVTPTDGVDLQLVDGRPTTLRTEPAYTRVVQELDALASKIRPDEPWTTADLQTLDEMSMGEWLERNVANSGTRASARKVMEGLMTVPVADMSLLTMLHAARTSGTLAAALGIEGGAQEQRVLGGLHGLAMRMASDLGEAVQLSAPVTFIRSSNAGVSVSSPSGVVSASRCIVAVPPSGWRRITFEPELPPAHVALSDAMPLGSVIKLQVVYDRPFWREAGYSGLVIDASGPFSFMVDNTSPDHPEGVLVTFLSAETADRWGDRVLGPEAATVRRKALVEHVCAAFGSRGSAVMGYVDRDWAAVPYVGGGYSGVMRPGGWSRTGAALRAPVGRLHWASAESAHEWNGYVEGALDAGDRAAAEVLAEL